MARTCEKVHLRKLRGERQGIHQQGQQKPQPHANKDKMFILNEREKTGKGRESRFLKLVVLSGAAVLTMRLASRYIFKTS